MMPGELRCIDVRIDSACCYMCRRWYAIDGMQMATDWPNDYRMICYRCATVADRHRLIGPALARFLARQKGWCK